MEAFFRVGKLDDVGIQAEQGWPTVGSVGLERADTLELNLESCLLLVLQMPYASFPVTLT